MLYKKGLNTIIITTVISFIASFLLFTSLQGVLLLPVNLLQHLLSVLFFIGFGLVLWGLIIKQEFKTYKFSLRDVFGVIIFLLVVADNWYTIVTPHPLFNDTYFI